MPKPKLVLQAMITQSTEHSLLSNAYIMLIHDGLNFVRGQQSKIMEVFSDIGIRCLDKELEKDNIKC